MNQQALFLDIESMDRDHLRIERMLALAAGAGDDDIFRLHAECACELADHFAREIAFLRARDFPGLHCHVAQHNILEAEMARAGGSKVTAAELRRRLGTSLPQLILSHISTMDRMAAAWLKGEIGEADFDNLRLPEPAP